MTGARAVPRFLRSRRFHLIMTLFWALLLVPTLIWWKSSILWVAAMSLYANVAAHWSAFQGARAEHKAGRRAPDLPGEPPAVLHVLRNIRRALRTAVGPGAVSGPDARSADR